MYFTYTQIANMNIVLDKVKLNTEILKDIIEKDLSSQEKKNMKKGVDYYNFRHDILDRVKKYRKDGVEIQDLISPNNKLVHPFLKILVDQLADYIAGIKPDISTEEEAYQEAIDKFLTDKFYDMLVDWIKNTSKKSIEWFHVYINTKGELKTVIVPAQQIIPVWDTQYQDELVGVIRYYKYQLKIGSGETVDRYKVEWWTDENVTYYEQLEDELFVFDTSYTVNPSPHYIKSNSSNNVKLPQSWGRVPFIPLKNNTEGKTDLEAIKPLQDAFDLVKSDWVNDLETYNELVYAIKNLSGSVYNEDSKRGYSELRMIVESIREEKAIAVDDNGGVEVIRSEIPVEAKRELLLMLRKEIFYFGQGVDVGQSEFGNDPSGVSLQFQYAPLDLKADAKIRKLQVALQEYFWFITEYINRTQKKSYDPANIEVKFNKSIIFNQKELTETINSMEISQEGKLELYPLVPNPDTEMERIKNERSGEIAEIEAQLNRTNDITE